MKNKILISAVIVFFSSVIFFGWGDKGHKTVASYAMKNLSSIMKIPADWQSYVVEHAPDPDYRKKDDNTEGSKHFIDIDYYKEFKKGKMILSLDSLKALYPDTMITKMGTLPWAVEVSYNNLIKAFKEKKKSNILLFMSDIAHYVADAHQPQHTCLNYNGQLTGQKGLHFRYEIDMLDSNLTELKAKFESGKPGKIKEIRSFIFDIVTRANTFADVITSADKFALANNGSGQYDDIYRKLMWYRTKYMTIDQMNLAGKNLASVIYSAWLTAGSPKLNSIK
jgi:hypothetical protein